MVADFHSCLVQSLAHATSELASADFVPPSKVGKRCLPRARGSFVVWLLPAWAPRLKQLTDNTRP